MRNVLNRKAASYSRRCLHQSFLFNFTSLPYTPPYHNQRDLNMLKTLLPFAAVCVVSAERVSIPFGNGWRFHLGDDPAGCGAGPGGCSFATDVTGMECTNMESDPDRFTVEDCKTSCCYDDACMVWQQRSGQQDCYHGGSDAVCTAAKTDRIGGKREAAQPFQTNYSFAEVSYNDAAWDLISVPHDFAINGTFYESDDTLHGFLPRNVSWYRKTFTAPAGGSTVLRFDGAFHFKEIFLNGALYGTHRCGYTPFDVRVPSGMNTLSIRVDASFGSGHWYEGGGLYRHVEMVHYTSGSEFVWGGVFVDPAYTSGPVHVLAEVTTREISGAGQLTTKVTILDGTTVVAQGSLAGQVTVGEVTEYRLEVMPTTNLTLWSPANPKQYKVQVDLTDGAEVLDTVHVSSGFRNLVWSTSGLAVNGEVLPLQGFSHHNSFAGTGVMQSPRLDLFRARASMALGANYWRMSHNPYDESLYHILSSMGIMSWDENRDFGTLYTVDFETMIRHHRNHATVTVWSFCNEFECAKWLGNATGNAFQAVAKRHDPNRNTTVNLSPGTLDKSPLMADIIGLSHQNNHTFETYHGQHGEKPLILSECCSCTTERLTDRIAENTCMESQNSPKDLPYVSGSIGVWTLMDYFGEQQTWPKVTCEYGQFDAAGFPKPHAWYYARNWRNGGLDASVCRIVTMLSQNATEVSGVVGTSQAQLYVDGKKFGATLESDISGAVHWSLPAGTLSVDNVTLIAVGGSVHTLLQPEKAVRMELVIDVPSASTGTGSKVYLDGHDIALVRAQLLDSRNTVVTGTDSMVNVTWSVVSGPAKVLGVGNGNQSSHQHNQGNEILTYGGLARAVIQVTTDCVSSGRTAAMSADKEQGPVTFAADCTAVTDIVVEATAPGFTPARITIPTSGDVQYSPMEEAKQKVTTYTYLDDTQA